VPLLTFQRVVCKSAQAPSINFHTRGVYTDRLIQSFSLSPAQVVADPEAEP